jgi:hypothetical protein
MGKRKADSNGDRDWDIAARHYFMVSRRNRLDDDTEHCNVGFEVLVQSINK